MKQKILITGGSGFVGSSLIEILKKKYLIFSVDKKKPLINKKFKFLKSDFCSNKVLKLINKENIQIIIHLAAYINVVEGERNRKKYILNNFTKSKKFFEKLKKTKVKKFIFSSSAAVYGDKKKKIKENESLNTKSVYGKTKKDFENYLKSTNKHNINCLIFRFFNIGGLYKKLKTKKNNYNSFFYNMCKAYIKNKIFFIYGNKFNTKTGYSYRDFIHIKSLINIISKFINLNIKKFEIINVGNGIEIDLNNILLIVQKKLKKKIKVKIAKARKSEITYSTANIQKLKKKINFKPKNEILNIFKDELSKI